MKRFIAVRKNDKYYRSNGSTYFDLMVYQITRSGIKFIASQNFSSASYKGEISAASNMLVEAKVIPASWQTENAYYKYNSPKYHIDII